jgi:hypothetical protein
MNSSRCTALSMAIALAAVGGVRAEDLERSNERPPGQVSLGTGFEYSTGDYGSPDGDTNDWYVPFSVGYAQSNWRVKASVPYIRSTGPGNVLSAGETRVVIDESAGDCVRSSNSGSGSGSSGSGSGSSGSGSSNSGPGNSNDDSDSDGADDSVDCTVTTTSTVVTNPGTTTTTRETIEGFGDLTLAATYSFDPLAPAMPYIDVGAKIKFPTGKEELSTGAYDYTVRMDLYKPFGDFAAFGGVGYTFKGDIDPTADSDGLELDNVISASLGGEYRFTGAWLAGVEAGYKQASSAFAVDAWDLSSYATWRGGFGLSLTGTLGTGFTDASPDFFGGLSLVYRFDAPF